MSRVAFMSKAYSIRNFKPTPQLGCFDAVYTPHLGTLEIQVRFTVDFKNASQQWTADLKEAFEENCTSRVSEYWNDRFLISCTKSDFSDLIVKPTFVLRKVGADESAHYAVKAMGTLGARNTAVRPDGTASFGMQATDRYANEVMQMKAIQDALKRSFVVPMGKHGTGGQISFPVMSMLQGFAQNAKYVFTETQPQLTLTAMGTSSTSEAQRVKTVLNQFGMMGFNIVTKSEKRFGGGNCTQVKVSWDEAQFDAAFPTPGGCKPLLSQATIAHEFGHMMGLPDEYNMLCTQSTSMLRDVGLIRTDDEEAAHLENTNVGRNDSQSDNVKANQKLFHKDCLAAGLVPPPFGRPNMNIMSGGSHFQEFHCIPAWKALCEMTKADVKPSEWRIDLKK